MSKLKGKFGEKIKTQTTDGRSISFIVERIEDDDGNNVAVEVLPDEDNENGEIIVKLKENENCRKLTIKIVRNEDNVGERIPSFNDSQEIKVYDGALIYNDNQSTDIQQEVDDPETGQIDYCKASRGSELFIDTTKNEGLREHCDHIRLFDPFGGPLNKVSTGAICNDTVLAEVKQELVEPEEVWTDWPIDEKTGISITLNDMRKMENVCGQDEHASVIGTKDRQRCSMKVKQSVQRGGYSFTNDERSLPQPNRRPSNRDRIKKHREKIKQDKELYAAYLIKKKQQNKVYREKLTARRKSNKLLDEEYKLKQRMWKRKCRHKSSTESNYNMT